jgi:precorrin-6B methylase 2
MVVLQLDLKPGSVVIEAGTGSASLSHAILRTIAPSGHLYTFDFHSQRVKTAHDEFIGHGFSESLVTVALRDVCTDGFGISDSIANAVFLDLPSPWQAIPFAAKALLPGGRLCSFSPCIEQVQRACLAMRDAGFTDITTLECLQRALDVRTVVVPMPDLGYGPSKFYGGVGTGIESDQRTVMETCPVTGHVEIGECGTDQESSLKKARHFEKTECSSDCESIGDDEKGSDQGREVKGLSSKRFSKQKQTKASYVFKSAMPPLQMNGHTGFLTFATLYPS